jgi:hypothetical protein
VPRSGLLGTAQAATTGQDLHFVQISDSHIGFSHDPNTDVPGTLQAAVDAVKGMPQKPAWMLHTATSATFPSPRNSTPPRK